MAMLNQLIPVSELAERLAKQEAASLAKELLPNGYRSGNYWMASGLDDTGKSASLWVCLSGPKIGRWQDEGNARAGADKGDLIDLLAHKRFAGDGKLAVQEAKRRLGIVDKWSKNAPRPSPAELAAREAEARKRAEARAAEEHAERASKIRGARALFLHDKAKLVAGTPVERYLRGRGLSAAPLEEWPGSLRHHPEAWNREHEVKMHAMLGMVLAWDGQKQVHVATHRTYLQHCNKRGWTKIDGKNARMALGPWSGGYIPINKGSSNKSMTDMHPDEPVYMAEGIEKCIAIRMKMPGARILSGLNLKNMGRVLLPPQARRLVMVVDNDIDPREGAALERAIAQQQARGLTVQLVRPPLPYKDIDEWMIAVAPGAVPPQQGRAA